MFCQFISRPAQSLSGKFSSKTLCLPLIASPVRIKHTVQGYSTFNAQQNAGNKQQKKKIPLWPRIRAFTTFTFSGILVIGATGLAGVVIYLIGAELFSPSGDTQIFNRAVSKVENDEVARRLLKCNDTETSTERLKAYGEILTDDRWTRNRPISSTRRIDKEGKEHYLMRFHVESKQKMGIVHVEAKESDVNYQPDFVSMYLDIPGEKRHYLIKPKLSIVKPKGFLGVNWGPKRD
ncbi:Tim21p [Kluyveromyces lactis]|uniref:Mitochondrial import inner membrane translocase subunit TIM21 n=1 Tax=Kluyveromyces lactis (strain ATCC 8585 / CBS 2359 / DSM 70799 / NBRC 1267 / NRRL Y-1140 / WM37) TaxID=284590 RepID=TIM21_KLULA|nr:uncharacterized protein KLLA0_B05786g [Kluyveromyces lactis]Q6CW96.1 RecName: Full=Mitochondrial import inner membrane translocase subunit TIM21; Flags: Precursor [Kluyveromyces lactis NRRL Y-1140]CAH02186.1 KLLA0B05786p [Kluyveromyces lactis]|eukprot:XP_451793.1 uncharacterized protein KLLA0_B05786g [Kluyveromyces lactis]